MACPTLKWKDRWLARCADSSRSLSYYVLASPDVNLERERRRAGDILGSLHMRRDEEGALVIESISVEAKRTRLGTALYELAAEVACAEHRVLASDSTRSPFAEAFWRKQKTKGRAMCVPGEGTYFDEPLNKLHRRLERGEIEPSEYRAIVTWLPQPDKRTWPCLRYEIATPCSTSSLARLPARRRRRRR